MKKLSKKDYIKMYTKMVTIRRFEESAANLYGRGLIGGFCLGVAMTGFIFSITMTTAAVTLFMLAAMPFIAAVFGFLILGEILRRSTLISMFIAFFGVCIMIINDWI